MELSIRENPLSKSSTLFLLILAFIQGVSGFFLHYAINNFSLFKNYPQVTVILIFVVAYVPLFIYVTYRRSIVSKKYCLGIALFSLIIIWIAWYIGSESDTTVRMLSFYRNNFFSFGHFFAINCFCFIALFFFKGSLHEGQFPPTYQSQFGFSWHNYLSLKLSFVFVGILFGILQLWGELFKAVNIGFFHYLFKQEWFLYPVLSVAFAYALIMFRTQINAVGAMQRILRVLFKVLLPLLLGIVTMFISVLPFTGASVIWENNFGGSATLLGVLILTLFHFNAVYQDGTASPYQDKMSKIIRYATLMTLVFAVLSLYGISARVQQYGLTPTRIWGLILACLSTVYLLAHSVISLMDKEKWSDYFGKINAYFAIVIMGVCLLLFTPLLNLNKLSADSQYQRFITKKVSLENMNFYNLARLGKHGLASLELIKLDESIVGDKKQIAKIDQAIKNRNRYYAIDKDFMSNDDIGDTVLVYPQGAKVNEKYWSKARLRQGDCTSTEPCFLILKDINSDEKDEYVLIHKKYKIYQLSIHQLTKKGTLSFVLQKQFPIEQLSIEKLQQALATSGLKTKNPRWKNLLIDDVEIPIFGRR